MLHFEVKQKYDKAGIRYYLYNSDFRTMDDLVQYYSFHEVDNVERIKNIRLLHGVHAAKNTNGVRPKVIKHPEKEKAIKNPEKDTKKGKDRSSTGSSHSSGSRSSTGSGEKLIDMHAILIQGRKPDTYVHPSPRTLPRQISEPGFEGEKVSPPMRQAKSFDRGHAVPSTASRPSISNDDPLLPIAPEKPKSKNPFKNLFSNGKKKRSKSDSSAEPETPHLETQRKISAPERPQMPLPDIPGDQEEGGKVCPYIKMTPEGYIDMGGGRGASAVEGDDDYNQVRDTNRDRTQVSL